MILDSESVALPETEAIHILRDSAMKFWLTGSRFMQCAKETSDWDFIVEDSEKAMSALSQAGFATILKSYDYDALTFCVMELGDVQVQLTKDVPLKLKCRDIIMQHMLEKHIRADREQRHKIWNTLAGVLSYDPATDDELPF